MPGVIEAAGTVGVGGGGAVLGVLEVGMLQNVIASHHMEDISELCDTVYSLDSGRLINTYENQGAVDESDITKVKSQDEGQR